MASGHLCDTQNDTFVPGAPLGENSSNTGAMVDGRIRASKPLHIRSPVDYYRDRPASKDDISLSVNARDGEARPSTGIGADTVPSVEVDDKDQAMFAYSRVREHCTPVSSWFYPTC